MLADFPVFVYKDSVFWKGEDGNLFSSRVYKLCEVILTVSIVENTVYNLLPWFI